MAKDKIDPGTFGNSYWSRPPAHGRGHSRRELQDRASFDNEPAKGCGAPATMLLATLATVAHLAYRAGRSQS
ncbi:hypothetical protein ACFW20_07185 [Streptomyces nigra]|uniref:hypothetical protein n=1 Tax=Streptomyces nigra TaxID=1827580 RepID=UPI0036BC3EC3